MSVSTGELAGATASPAYRLRLLVALGILSAFAPLSIDIYLPALPGMARDLHASTSLVQLTLTATLLGLAGGQIVAGPLSDRRGRRPPMLGGLLLFSGGCALCAAAPDVWTLVVFRFLQGLGGAVSLVLARAIVRDLWVGVGMSRILSRLFLVMGISPVLAPMVGAQILRVTSWRGVFLALAALGLAILVFTASVVPETLHGEPSAKSDMLATLRAFRRIAADRAFSGYALAVGGGYGMLFAYIAGAPFVVQEVYGASPTIFSLIFAVNAIGITACSQLNAWLVGRVRMRRLLFASLVAMAAGSVSVLLTSGIARLGLVALMLSLLVAIAPIGMLGPNASALALASYADAAGSASALMGVLQFVIGAATSPLVGIAGQKTALPMALVMTAQSLMALATLWLLTRDERGGASPSLPLRQRAVR